MVRRKLSILGLVFLVLLLVTAGCARQQEKPAPGENGDGGGNGARELDIESLVTQWTEAAHANIQLRPAQTEGCVICHDGGAFVEQVNDPAEIDRDFFVSIDCRACHMGHGTELMKSGTISIPTQDNVKAGTGALCLFCHNERRAPSISDENRSAPHYSSQAGVYTASGGIKREGFNYGSTTAHAGLENTCVSCHMTQTGDGFASHTFAVENVQAACGSCHQNISTVNLTARNDYDGDGEARGFQDEVQGLLDKVEEAVVATFGGGSIESAHGQVVFKNTAGEELQVPDEVYLAGYNYKLVSNDGSLGIHNPRYVVQLLQQSYRAVTGEDVPNAHILE